MAIKAREVKVRCDRCVHFYFRHRASGHDFGMCRNEAPGFLPILGSDWCRAFEAKGAECDASSAS